MPGVPYRNVGLFLLALPVVMIAGFWIPYLSEFPTFRSISSGYIHVHAALLFSWVALLVVQPLAIRSRAFALHRALGKTSILLMPPIALSAVLMVALEYREHIAAGVSPATALKDEYLSSVQLLLLVAFFSLAIARIRARDVRGHMRYMICIALVLMPAALSRTLGYWLNMRQTLSQAISLGLIDAFLIGLIFYDRYRGLTPRPYFVALGAYLAVEAGWVLLRCPV